MWEHVQARTMEALPAVTAAVFVLAVGAFLGWIARRIVVALLRRKQGRWQPEGLGLVDSLGRWNGPLVIGRSVQWFVIFCSTIVALYALDPRLASTLAERVLLYVPHLAGALLILIVGILSSKYVARMVLIASVNHEIGSPRLLAAITRTAVVILTIAIAFEFAGIGERTVLTAFAILFGGLTLAASIAVGLALKEPMRRWIGDQDLPSARRERDAKTMHHV